MAQQFSQPGDFVQVEAPGYEKRLYAIRSIHTDTSDVGIPEEGKSITQIVIYPLDEQTRESILVFQDGKWVVLGAETIDFKFEFLPGDPAYYEAFEQRIRAQRIRALHTDPETGHFNQPVGYYEQLVERPNEDDIEEIHEALTEYQDSLERLEQIYADLSPLKITPQQFVHALQEPFGWGMNNPRFTPETLEWLLRHQFAPKTYTLSHLIKLGRYDLFERLDQVSETTNPYTAIIENTRSPEISKYIEYFAENGVVPNDYELSQLIIFPQFNRAITILVSRGLIEFTPKMERDTLVHGNIRLNKMIRSLVPTKSSMKR